MYFILLYVYDMFNMTIMFQHQDTFQIHIFYVDHHNTVYV